MRHGVSWADTLTFWIWNPMWTWTESRPWDRTPLTLLTSSVTTLTGRRGNNCQVKEWVFP